MQWMLKSGLGGVVEVPDKQGRPIKLRIVGLLQDSVFQSELVMSAANFTKLYPRQEGFSVFLLDPPAGRHEDVTSLFQTALDSRGVRITPAKERLAAYLAVENTYLSTFQVLGGFGLLLGALGLAVVLCTTSGSGGANWPCSAPWAIAAELWVGWCSRRTRHSCCSD